VFSRRRRNRHEIEFDLSTELIEWTIWMIGDPTKVLTPYCVQAIVRFADPRDRHTAMARRLRRRAMNIFNATEAKLKTTRTGATRRPRNRLSGSFGVFGDPGGR
jgi:hypothetical protein